MAYQSSSRVLAAVHRETAINVQATATGATQVRIVDSPGLEYKHAVIQSQERLVTGLVPMGRLGYESVDGSFNTELSSGGHIDMFTEAIMRNAWVTATSFSFASVTTVAIATGTLTPGASSSFITAGVRVGDIFNLSSTTVSGNNSLNVPVLSIAAASGGAITVPAASFTTLAASATGTLTILKKVVNGTAGITDFSHTIEQYDSDTDLSELFTGNRVVGAKYSFKPGAPAMAQFTFLGCDRTALTTGTSPYFTSPSLTTGLVMVPEDSSIRKNGAAVATFTSLDIDIKVNAAGLPVIGSTTTPDIFTNQMSVDVTVAGPRSDFSDLTLFDAETEFELMIKLEEPNTGPPKSCFFIYIPRAKIGTLSAPLGGGDGAKIVTLTLMTGPKAVSATTGVEATVIKFVSSAA